MRIKVEIAFDSITRDSALEHRGNSQMIGLMLRGWGKRSCLVLRVNDFGRQGFQQGVAWNLTQKTVTFVKSMEWKQIGDQVGELAQCQEAELG